MRKFIWVLLSALCICCAAIGLTGCKKDKHIHAFDKQVITDEYKATDATCTEAATYYYSCSCGEKGTETFTSGNALGHSFTNYVSDNNATCTEDGTKTAKCDRCNEKDTVIAIGTKLGHSFTNYVSDNNATCTEDGTKTAKCDRCNETDTIPDENSKLESKMTFKTLTVGEKNTDGNVSVYGKVPNAQKTYSFIDEIKTEGVARFVVSTDVYGMHTVVTKTIPLSEGDNKIFVIELNGEDVKSIYEVTIRRRPVYSVVFDTNGGTILDSRQIEEGTVITAPETTKAGYTFIEWDYDFTQPITQNTTIKATWSTNTNTPYKVEYYKENIEDDNYTLCETSDLQGVSDAIASAEQKAYEHFTFDENESVPSGAIAGDGSLILKMYYKRNVYAISNANSAYGEITSAATIKYGSPIKGLATEYLGCEFIGWFNGETLLSSAKRYEFTAECDVYAKFKAKDEMSDFNFKSSTTACEIMSLKDKNAASVVIPDCVTSIGEKAFYNCDKLTSVTIPDSVTSIGSNVFNHYRELTSIYISDLAAWCKIVGLDNLMGLSLNNNLYLNGKLITDLIIPNGVTSIGDSAFERCSGLTSVTIPNSVTSIGWGAFNYCGGLTNITIPDSVTFIGYFAFDNCVNLRYNEYDNAYYLGNENNPHFALMKAKNTNIDFCSINVNTKIISSNAFGDCGNLTNILIPDSITSIGDYAFENCSGLASVTIPDSVTSIGGGAFGGCSGLTSITIPDSVTSIDGGAFRGCSGLTSITIPRNVTSIGGGVFRGCSKLMNVEVANGNSNYHSQNNCIIETATRILIAGCNNSVIPNDGSVTAIGTAAFSGCSFTTITIPDSITSIGNSAFSHCSELTSITIPDSVTFIDDGAFWNCSELTSITIPYGITSIGYGTFWDCSGLTSVTIPDSVTSIGDYAFEGCSSLTSVTIPDSVTSIGSWAFSGCSGLTSVTIPDSVTSIGDSAFKGCSGLANIIIPDSVTSIGDYAFYDCSGLKSVTIPDGVTSIGNGAFGGCNGLTSVIIPNSVTSIGNYAFSGCSGLTSVTYLGTIDQWAEISFGDSSNPLCYAHNLYINDELVTEVNLTTATKISAYAFGGCSGLTSVTIPDSVTSIGNGAFLGCSGLESITVSSDNTKYHSSENCLIETESKMLILGCNNSVIPTDGSVTSIGDDAFYNCSGLTSVTIGNSVTSIGNFAFV